MWFCSFCWGMSFHFFLFTASLAARRGYRNLSTMQWCSDPYWLPSASCAQRTGPSCSLEKLWSRPIHCSVLFLTRWWGTSPSRVRRYHQKPPSSALLRVAVQIWAARGSRLSFTAVWDDANAHWYVGVILAFWAVSQDCDQSNLFLPTLFLSASRKRVLEGHVTFGTCTNSLI